MRYKFRGKDQRGQWHYGSLVMGWMYDENLQPFDTAYIQKNIHRAAVQVLPETVGQYTGLKDKNGVEIYEGDILKVPDLYETPENTSTTYHNELVGFEQCAFTLGGQPLTDDAEYVSDECEVIGNRWDNSDLLGEVRG